MYMALARYWVAGVRYKVTDTRYWVIGVRYNVHGQVLGNRCKVQGNQVLGTLYQVLSQEVQLVPAEEDTQAVSTSLKSSPTAVNIWTRGTLTSLSGWQQNLNQGISCLLKISYYAHFF